jgi:hypothetical protein
MNALGNVLIVLVILGFFARVVFVLKRHSSEKRQVANELIKWSAMERIWDELYYCFRDDIVFRGTSPSRYASPEDALRLLIE